MCLVSAAWRVRGRGRGSAAAGRCRGSGAAVGPQRWVGGLAEQPGRAGERADVQTLQLVARAWPGRGCWPGSRRCGPGAARDPAAGDVEQLGLRDQRVRRIARRGHCVLVGRVGTEHELVLERHGQIDHRDVRQRGPGARGLRGDADEASGHRRMDTRPSRRLPAFPQAKPPIPCPAPTSAAEHGSRTAAPPLVVSSARLVVRR